MSFPKSTSPKVCAACLQLLPRDQFAPILTTNGSQNGVNRRCKTCQANKVPIRGTEKKTRLCADCGTAIGRKAARCSRCQNQRSADARSIPIAERITNAYIVEDRGYKTPCWIWQRSTDSTGYGHINTGDCMIQAHRFLYQERNGELPQDVELHHLCEVRRCICPDHLEPLTRVDHMEADGRRSALIARNQSQAARAYDAKLREFHGEFARTNFPS